MAASPPSLYLSFLFLGSHQVKIMVYSGSKLSALVYSLMVEEATTLPYRGQTQPLIPTSALLLYSSTLVFPLPLSTMPPARGYSRDYRRGPPLLQ
jgi:hypothetical protein